MDVRDELRAIEVHVKIARAAYEVVNDQSRFERDSEVRDALWRITDSLEHLADAVQRLAWVVGADHADGG